VRAIVRDTGQTFLGLRRLRLEYAGFVVGASTVWVPAELSPEMFEDHLNQLIEEAKKEKEAGDG
jgi:hypothetical protein